MQQATIKDVYSQSRNLRVDPHHSTPLDLTNDLIMRINHYKVHLSRIRFLSDEDAITENPMSLQDGSMHDLLAWK